MTVEGLDLIERRGFAQLAAAIEAGADLLRDGYVVRVQKDERAPQGRRWLLEGWAVPADEPDIALLPENDVMPAADMPS